jgi:hypothetical protein
LRGIAGDVHFCPAVTKALFEDVADTASWVAAYRARESAAGVDTVVNLGAAAPRAVLEHAGA